MSETRRPEQISLYPDNLVVRVVPLVLADVAKQLESLTGYSHEDRVSKTQDHLRAYIINPRACLGASKITDATATRSLPFFDQADRKVVTKPIDLKYMSYSTIVNKLGYIRLPISSVNSITQLFINVDILDPRIDLELLDRKGDVESLVDRLRTSSAERASQLSQAMAPRLQMLDDTVVQRIQFEVHDCWWQLDGPDGAMRVAYPSLGVSIERTLGNSFTLTGIIRTGSEKRLLRENIDFTGLFPDIDEADLVIKLNTDFEAFVKHTEQMARTSFDLGNTRR